MMLLSLSAFYFVNKNDATVTFSLFLSQSEWSYCHFQLYLVNKNDATVTFSFLLNSIRNDPTSTLSACYLVNKNDATHFHFQLQFSLLLSQ